MAATVKNHWLEPDKPARDVLAGSICQDIGCSLEYGFIVADAAIKAGWVSLERFRHDTTNTLGMFMVHEDGDPDLGYDRGIVDAMDVVNGTLWTGPGALDCRAANRNRGNEVEAWFLAQNFPWDKS